MYSMRVVASNFFHLMIFTHDGKIVIVDQLTYHDPQGLTVPSNVIPTVNTIFDDTPSSQLLNVGPGLFVDTTMTTSFPLVSPPLTPN